jgi:hypothetical protein
VNCDGARLRIGADPNSGAADLGEHLQGCPQCAAFREEMRTFDARIRRAMEHPPQLTRMPRPARAAPWRGWALAASVALAMFAVLAVWLLRPADTLASDVVAHVQAEPNSWLASHGVSARGIDAALRGAGVELNINSDRITYAESCWFRGYYVPHLVVQTADGPATVLILRHEHVPAARSFHERGMSGVIVPAGDGSIAVLTRGAGNDVGPLAAQLSQDMRWLPQAP